MTDHSNRRKEELRLAFDEVAGMEILNTLFDQTRSYCDANEISHKTMYRLNLVLEEHITNIIKFGFSRSPEKKISIHLSNHTNYIQLEISDTGEHFDTPKMIAKMNNRLPDENVIGKRGLIIIDKMTFDFQYRREENRNVIRCKMDKTD
jgi:serine/threonine-protein kinase RsbW